MWVRVVRVRESQIYFGHRELDCVLLDFSFSVVNVLSLGYSLNFSDDGQVIYAFKCSFNVVGYLKGVQ